MITFREYLDRERLKKHVKHHNGVQGLRSAFSGASLDKAKKLVHTGGESKSERLALSKFAQEDDKPRKGKASKWQDLWAKVRADLDDDS